MLEEEPKAIRLVWVSFSNGLELDAANLDEPLYIFVVRDVPVSIGVELVEGLIVRLGCQSMLHQVGVA